MRFSSRPVHWVLLSVAVLGSALAVFNLHSAGQTAAADVDNHALARQRIAQLPMVFEVNRGQGSDRAQYLARGTGYQIALDAAGATYTLAPMPEHDATGRRQSKPVATVVRMTVAGGNPKAKPEGLQRQPGVSNYLRGNPSQWLRDIEHYAQVKYHDVYPGVDLVYYGNQHKLEYDFVVAPDQDPDRIALEFDGVQGLRVDARGDLVLSTAQGDLVQHKPVVYQQLGEQRRIVDARYAVLDDRRVGFALGAYDRGSELVIDPVLEYSTFLGASRNDSGYGIAVDRAGYIYVAGEGGPVGSFLNDAFVAKYNPEGTALIYHTYVGGSKEERGFGVAVDGTGQAWVVGYTESSDFPITASAIYPGLGIGPGVGFISKLNAAGNGLLFSTYYANGYRDQVQAIAVDVAGNAYVTGMTRSDTLKLVAPLQTKRGGGGPGSMITDAFVSKLSPSGALLYSTYLGGTGNDWGASIAVGSDGSIHVAGATESTDFPLAGARQAVNGGGHDAFVARIAAPGKPLLNSSYLGGSGNDDASAVALDTAGNVYVAGRTDSTNFPLATPIKACLGSPGDGFVTKLNATATALVYSTCLGGSDDDKVHGIAVDRSGRAHVTGVTYSDNFSVNTSIHEGTSGGMAPDAFVSRLDPSGKTMLSSYLGHSGGNEFGQAIAVDLAGNAWIAGTETPVDSDHVDFPLRAPLDPVAEYGEDAFVAKVAAPTARSWQGDFDGDGKSDILWRNTATGTNSVWRWTSNTRTGQALPSVAASWTVAAVGDFDADGKSDLWWRNRLNGANVVWPSANSLSAQVLSPVNINWTIAAVGDFDNDGKSDLLWRDLTTGSNVIWKAGNKTNPQSVARFDLDWRVVGAGDFDGDGRDDILWGRGSSGESQVWLAAATAQALTPFNRAWDPVGIADFNGDGRDDILWRIDSLDRNTLWLSASSATQQAVAGFGTNAVAYVNYGWFVAGTGDYDGDGKADILWRNSVTAENQLWKAGNQATQLEVPDTVVQAWNIFS